MAHVALSLPPDAAEYVSQQKPRGFFQTEQRNTWALRSRLLWLLATEGPVTDESGRATTKLQAQLGVAASSTYFSGLLRMLETEDGLIKRQVNGKRCYSIELAIPRGRLEAHPRYGADLYAYSNLPPVFRRFAEEYEAKEEADEPPLRIVKPEAEENQPGPVPAEVMQAALVPEEAHDTPRAPALPEDPAALLLVAITAISQAMGVLRASPATVVDPKMAQDLWETREDRNRWKAKAEAVADDARVQKEIAANLRTKITALEENLSKIAQGAGFDPKTLRNFKDWDRMIRSAPESAKA